CLCNVPSSCLLRTYSKTPPAGVSACVTSGQAQSRLHTHTHTYTCTRTHTHTHTHTHKATPCSLESAWLPHTHCSGSIPGFRNFLGDILPFLFLIKHSLNSRYTRCYTNER